MSDPTFETYLAPDVDVLPDTEELCASRTDLTDALLRLESAVMPEDVPTITELSDQFADVAVKVSLIGQVKAGKTALANALLGVSDLLPSDVNPWTSVVTSMHINRVSPKGKKAVFKFFDTKDWDDLVSNSGQIVAMAKKAKLDTRVDELTAQIETLKARTEARLGHNFKMLLGNQHSFSTFNADLIKRYVCLGEDDMVDEKEGRFADLTKSADLYLENDSFPYPITISDTPGVNDPFLVREAATLDSLRTANLYVVVLSAHQALSSVDLGLLRVIKNLHSDRLIVFINRIDELPDPQAQVEEIKTYVTEILRKQNITDDIPIIFGSAAWADAAIRGNYDALPEDSVESLGALIERRKASLKDGAIDDENIRNLVDVSGVSALRRLIHRKAWTEVFNTEITKTANKARLLAERSLIYLTKATDGPNYVPDPAGIQAALDKLSSINAQVHEACTEYERAASDQLKLELAAVYTSFQHTEKRALMDVLSKSRKTKDWSPDTEELRTNLNLVYKAYVNKTEDFLKRANGQVLKAVTAAYAQALGSSEGLRITPVPLPDAPVPVALMRTMSIDLRASSSMEWLRRKLDKSVYLDQLDATVYADSRDVSAATCDEGVTGYFEQIRAAFEASIASHIETIAGFAKTGAGALEERLKKIIDQDGSLSGRLISLRETGDILHALESAVQQPDETETSIDLMVKSQ